MIAGLIQLEVCEVIKAIGGDRERPSTWATGRTHGLPEEMAMAHRLVVLNQGAIEQIGSPGAVFERPANHFVKLFLHSFDSPLQPV